MKELEGENSLDTDDDENYKQIYPLEKIRIEKGRMSLFEIKRRQERGDIQLSPEFKEKMFGIINKNQSL
ncbi:hypothetical protein ACOTVD_10555 [Campylobacter jejuni]|uniref:hypothetical protein n=1 Tax=Campylobacter jejuni TaxID=197 RepID=UPI003B9C3630